MLLVISIVPCGNVCASSSFEDGGLKEKLGKDAPQGEREGSEVRRKSEVHIGERRPATNRKNNIWVQEKTFGREQVQSKDRVEFEIVWNLRSCGVYSTVFVIGACASGCFELCVSLFLDDWFFLGITIVWLFVDFDHRAETVPFFREGMSSYVYFMQPHVGRCIHTSSLHRINTSTWIRFRTVIRLSNFLFLSSSRHPPRSQWRDTNPTSHFEFTTRARLFYVDRVPSFSSWKITHNVHDREHFIHIFSWFCWFLFLVISIRVNRSRFDVGANTLVFDFLSGLQDFILLRK